MGFVKNSVIIPASAAAIMCRAGPRGFVGSFCCSSALIASWLLVLHNINHMLNAPSSLGLKAHYKTRTFTRRSKNPKCIWRSISLAWRPCISRWRNRCVVSSSSKRLPVRRNGGVEHRDELTYCRWLWNRFASKVGWIIVSVKTTCCFECIRNPLTIVQYLLIWFLSCPEDGELY